MHSATRAQIAFGEPGQFAAKNRDTMILRTFFKPPASAARLLLLRYDRKGGNRAVGACLHYGLD